MGIGCTVYIICTLLYFLRAKQRESREERLLLIGFGLLFISMTIVMFTWFIMDFEVPGYYLNHSFYGDLAVKSSLSDILEKVSYVMRGICFTIIPLTFPTKAKKLIWLITCVNVFFIFFIFEPGVFILFFTMNLIILFILLLGYMKTSSKELQSVFFFILFGSLIVLLGTALRNNTIRNSNVVPIYTIPIFLTIGPLIWISPMLMKTNGLERSLNIWPVLGFTISISSTILSFLLNFIIGEVGVDTVLTSIVYWVLFLVGVKFARSSETTTSKKKETSFMSSFIRPKKVTEEEVSISKEKKVCLVCKGKVLRYDIYICPDCSSLYHQKCAKTLEGLENACWACDAPFDETKPVKLDKKEQPDELEIEQETHKGDKK